MGLPLEPGAGGLPPQPGARNLPPQPSAGGPPLERAAAGASLLGPELAGWTRSLRRSALEDMLVETARPDVLSLALGLPAAEFFPVSEMREAAERVLVRETRALQYAPPIAELRERVADLMRARGVRCRPEQIFLTAGAQQGMSLAVRLLADRGDPILVESHCYTGFQQAMAELQPRICTVPTSPETGIDVEAVERLLRSGVRPALIYTMSDGHNPMGVSMPPESRARLTELARAWSVPILEDDAYGFLSYEESPTPALRAYDADWVLYLGSFSKTLAPALRTGWIVLPERMAPAFASLKESSDINTATFGQRLVAEFAISGRFESHVDRLRRAYALRRDTMLAALDRSFPSGTRWSHPRAGFFTWVELPPPIDTTALLATALERERVAFVPGAAFAAGDAAPHLHALRLNYSHVAPETIEDGVTRIANAIEELRGSGEETP